MAPETLTIPDEIYDITKDNIKERMQPHFDKIMKRILNMEFTDIKVKTQLIDNGAKGQEMKVTLETLKIVEQVRKKKPRA